MKKVSFLLALSTFLLSSCSNGEEARPLSFSGIVYEYASETPLQGVPVEMYAKNSPQQLDFLANTQTDELGQFYFEPERQDTILAYFYQASLDGYSIQPPNRNAIAYLNEVPNYDTLVAYEDAFLKIIVNPVGGTDLGWFSVNVFTDEFQLGFPLLNRRIFQDSSDVQTSVIQLFKTKKPVTVSWSINFQDFSKNIELISQDTVTLSINY